MFFWQVVLIAAMTIIYLAHISGVPSTEGRKKPQYIDFNI
jgi:hypothetical protein